MTIICERLRASRNIVFLLLCSNFCLFDDDNDDDRHHDHFPGTERR